MFISGLNSQKEISGLLLQHPVICLEQKALVKFTYISDNVQKQRHLCSFAGEEGEI